MTYAALQTAFWLLVLGIAANAWQTVAPDSKTGLRLFALPFLAVKVFALIGIWPLVWGAS